MFYIPTENVIFTVFDPLTSGLRAQPAFTGPVCSLKIYCCNFLMSKIFFLNLYSLKDGKEKICILSDIIV